MCCSTRFETLVFKESKAMFFGPGREASGDGELPHYFDVALFCPPVLRARLDEPFTSGDEKLAEEVAQVLCHIDCRFVKAILARLRRKAPCLCCTYASKEKTEELSRELATIRGYFSYTSFEGTAVCRRAAQSLLEASAQQTAYRDLILPPVIKKAVKACRKVGQDVSWCYRQKELWFADRPGVTRFLRRAARHAKKIGGALKVSAPSIRRVLTMPAPGAIRCVKYYGASEETPITSPEHPVWACLISAAVPREARGSPGAGGTGRTS